MSGEAGTSLVSVGVGRALVEVARWREASIAVVRGDQAYSWADVLYGAVTVDARLEALGIGHGDRVGVDLENTFDHVCTLTALAVRGCTPFNINYRYTVDEVRWLVEQAEAAAVVTTAGRATVAYRDMLNHANVAALVVSAGHPDGAASPCGNEPCQEPETGNAGAASNRERLLARGEVVRESAEWIIFTGGTTGAPKAVIFRQSRLLAGALRNLGSRQRLSPDSTIAEFRDTLRDDKRQGEVVTYVAPPMIHGTGLTSAIGTLVVGGRVVLPRPGGFEAATLLDDVVQNRVSDLAIVGDVFARPVLAELEKRALRGAPADLSSLRVIKSVGARFSGDVKAGLLEHCDAEIVDVIAASEGGPFAKAVTTRADLRTEFRLAAGARLLGPDDEDITPGWAGSGLLAAPALHDVRYLHGLDGDDDCFRLISGEKYCVPGDLARLLDDGSLQFMGRSARIINTGGEKVFAEEVESAAMSHPSVGDVCVVGVDDPRWGSVVIAVASPSEGCRIDDGVLDEHVRGLIAGYKRPRQWIVVDQVRRSDTGKHDLKWARDLAAEASS